MIARWKRGHGKPACRSLAIRFGQMPPHGGGVHDVSFSGDKGIEPLDSEAQLAALDDPHLGEIVEVPAIARFVFDIGRIAANDIGVRTILSNRQDGP